MFVWSRDPCPATFTRSVVDTERERKRPGIWRATASRPATHRRRVGGDENWDHGNRRGPRALLIRYRMGIFSALAGDLMFFMALVYGLLLPSVPLAIFDPRGALYGRLATARHPARPLHQHRDSSRVFGHHGDRAPPALP